MPAEVACFENNAVVTKHLNEQEDFFYYFAFGSNLLTERIHVQVKGAEFVGVGVLKSFELTFYDHGRRWCGAAASIEPNSDSEVWGCVWRVPNSFSDELDLQEASYHRLSVSIHIPSHNNTEVVCRTYQYTHHTNMERLPPSPHYKHVIVSGAIEHGLPDDYVAKLKAILDNGYKGPIPLKLHVLEELNSVQVEEEADPDPELTKLTKAFEAMTKLCKTRFSSTSAPSHGTGTTLISELCGELRPKIA